MQTNFILWHLPKTHTGHQQSSQLHCQHTDFATELMEWLFALIDCCPPCGQMLKGDATPSSGRWQQSNDIQGSQAQDICLDLFVCYGRECASTAQTSTATCKLDFFSNETSQQKPNVTSSLHLAPQPVTSQSSHSTLNFLAQKLQISLNVL